MKIEIREAPRPVEIGTLKVLSVFVRGEDLFMVTGHRVDHVTTIHLHTRNEGAMDNDTEVMPVRRARLVIEK